MARPKKGEPSKTEFIRRHPELSIVEIVANARSAGMEILPRLVTQVRSDDKRTGRSTAPAKRSGGEAVRSPEAARANTITARKAAFISANASLPPAALEAKARRAGVEIVVVHDAERRPRVAPNGDAAFRRLVLDLGVLRAKQLVLEVESKLRTIIAGA